MKCEWGGDCQHDATERHYWLFPEINDGLPVWGQGYCAEHARMNIGCARTTETELYVEPVNAEAAISVEVMCHAIASYQRKREQEAA